MAFKGCERCSGDLWVEEDIVSGLEALVCVQCGHRQAVSFRSKRTPRPITSGAAEEAAQRLVPAKEEIMTRRVEGVSHGKH